MPQQQGETRADRADYLSILSGTSQNVVGIVIAGVATIGANLLMARVLGRADFGIVTVVTQAVFVASFATRAGMDMAVLRDVAVDVGGGRTERIRATVARAALIAVLVSAAVAGLAAVAAAGLRDLLSIDDSSGRWAIEAAALGLPFLALANVLLAATRGLKIMRHTLYIFWAGQPLAWIVLLLAGWTISETPWMSVLAYSLSWLAASVAAGAAWRGESSGWEEAPLEPGALGRLARYAGPRAPAALFSQMLFWTDLFVVTRYVSDTEIGVYSAVLRAGQVVVLFLTSVNLMFSPYVADLHARGEISRLAELFKTLTRWTIAATLPAFLLLAVAPASVLRMFGEGFTGGETALLILLGGQLINIATGSVGFVLIMVGRTGWDLVVYAGSLILDLALAFWLAPRHGISGAATANAITFGVSNALRLILVYRFLRIHPYDYRYLRLIFPAGVGAAVMAAVHAVGPQAWAGDLVLTFGAGSLAYAGAYLLWATTPAEKRGLREMLGKVRHKCSSA